MHFTPPVQTIYATIQALKEYWAEGEEAKWARHTRVFNAINEGLEELGFRQVIKPEWRAGLVSSAIYPNDPNWSFEKVHDYCYERGFTIYPGKPIHSDFVHSVQSTKRISKTSSLFSKKHLRNVMFPFL